MSAVGRPFHGEYKSLRFTPLKVTGKYKAACDVCGKTLANAATDRLIIHRRKCVPASSEAHAAESTQTSSTVSATLPSTWFDEVSEAEADAITKALAEY